MAAIYDQGFSKYQREAIVEASAILGDRFFRYEKAKNNHLKFIIDGIDKPIYTSSTPSDHKSLQNFSSRLRRLVRDAQNLPLVQAKLCLANPDQPSQCPHEKMVRSIVKNFRALTTELEQAEEKMVFAEKSVDGIAAYRAKIIRQAIAEGLGKRQITTPLKPNVMRCLTEDIARHLDFILPNTGHYANLLKRQTQVGVEHHTLSAQAEDFDQQLQIELQRLEQEKAKVAVKGKCAEIASQAKVEAAGATGTSVMVKESEKDTSDLIAEPPKVISMADRLVSMSSEARIGLFKTLKHQQAKTLFLEMQQAMTQRYEADCQAVIHLIQKNGLSIQDIATRLGQLNQ